MFDPRVFVFSYFVPSLACIITSFLSASGTVSPTIPLITFILSSLYILLTNLTVVYPLRTRIDLKDENDILYLFVNIRHLSRISSWFVSVFLLIVGYYIFIVPSPISYKTTVLLFVLVPALVTPTPNRIYTRFNETFYGRFFTWKSPTLTDLLPSLSLLLVTILSSMKEIHWLILLLMLFVCFSLLPALPDKWWVGVSRRKMEIGENPVPPVRDELLN